MKKGQNKVSIPSTEAAIRKQYGDIFMSYDMMEEQNANVIKSTLSLDIALGGGILEGTVISLSGNSGSGKSTLALTICASTQKQYGKKIYYFDVEHRIHSSLLKTIKGLDKEKISFVRSTKEKFLTAEDYLNIMINLLTTEENIVIVIDSIAMMCARDNQAKELGENKKMMNIPSLMYDGLRQTAPLLPIMRSNVILLTHLQANPTAYGGPTEVGGNAVKYQASTRLMCLSSQEVPKDGEKTGRVSEFKILKSSMGPGTGRATFPIKYGNGYDYERDLLGLARELGIFDLSGSWYTFPDTNGDEIKLQGEESVIEYLINNPEFTSTIDQKIRELAL